MSKTFSILAAACAGAGLMYLLDPQLGEDRRAFLSDKFSDFTESFGDYELPDVGGRLEDAKSYLKSMLPMGMSRRSTDRAMSRAADLRDQAMKRLGLKQGSSLGTVGLIFGVGACCALAGVGAYFMMGEERKQMIKGKAQSLYDSGMEQVSGLTDRAKQMIGRGGEDRKLADRVHFELNRLPFELRGLHVRSEPGGQIHIYCDCPAEHYDRIIEVARKVPGVRNVISHMQATAGV